MKPPLPIYDYVSFKPVADFVEAAMKDLSRGERVKDLEHYVFEAVMECMYGPRIWDFLDEEEVSRNFE